MDASNKLAILKLYSGQGRLSGLLIIVIPPIGYRVHNVNAIASLGHIIYIKVKP